MNFCLNINNPDISKLISLIGYSTLSQIIEYNGIEILDIIKEKPFIDLKDELRKSYEYQLNNKKFNDSIDNMNEISFWRMFTPSFYNWFGDWMIQYKLQNGLQLSEKEQDILATKYEGSYDRLKADVSKVVTDNGLPKLVYHGSNYDFTDFDTKYWGFAHFGTFDAAYDRLIRFKYGIEEDGYIINGTIKSYFLNIKKEKEIEDIGDKWEKISIADDEGLIYINKSEDKGSISYAISNPNQTKSAILPSENMGTLLIENLVEELKVTPTQAKQLIPTKFLNPTNSKIMYFQRLNGGTYGFVTPDGKVFIDKSTQSLNTPFHEFYHIYDKIILSNYDFDSRAKSIIDRANQLAVEGGYLNRVKQLNAYKDDDEEQQLAEARAMLIGDASSSKINEAEHGFLMKLKALLKDLVDYILDIIGTKSFKNYTPEQILNMTMEEFTNVMTHDMLYDKSFGKHLTPEQRQNIQELKDLEPAYAQASDEEVQEFIESIYPESKVKDIVYHATDKKFDKFDNELSVRKNTSKNHKGWYFTKIGAKNFVERHLGRTNVIELPVLLNMQNPYAVDDLDDIGEKLNIDSRFITQEDLKKLRNNNFDSVYTTHPRQKNISDAAELVVFEPEQITILNSPETIQKFQEFLDRKRNKTNFQDLTPVKPGLEELFDSNPELANQIYSKILTNSGLSTENLLSLLLKDNLIEKQCS